jgi:hypothetical protein
MRTYWRQRNDLVRAAGRHIQRMQKALTQMNIQLANVLSDVSGEEPFISGDLFSGGGQLVLETLGFEGEHPYRLQAHSAVSLKRPTH